MTTKLTLSSISLSVRVTVLTLGAGAGGGGMTWLSLCAPPKPAMDGRGTREPLDELGRDEEADTTRLPPEGPTCGGKRAGASFGPDVCSAAKCGLGGGRLSIDGYEQKVLVE